MREEGIKKFLEALGVRRSKMESSRGWVNCPCPMAPWTHGSGVDKRPSFGVMICEDGPSFYYCFGCSPKSSRLEGLLHNFFLMEGESPKDASRIFIMEENHADEDEGEEVHPTDAWSEEKKEVFPLPMEVVRKLPPLQWRKDTGSDLCREYLRGRGILDWVPNYLGVRYDPVKKCLAFPMTDVLGRIFMIRERSIGVKSMWTVSPEFLGMDKSIEFPKLKEAGVWFGMHLISLVDPVMLVEGEIDVMRLVSLGFSNVIASGTSSVSFAQLDAISGSKLFLGYDNDTAGQVAHTRIINHIGSKAVMYELDWGVVKRKDPGELKSEEELEEVILRKKLVK